MIPDTIADLSLHTNVFQYLIRMCYIWDCGGPHISGVATGGAGGVGSGKLKIRKFAIWRKMTPNYSAVLDVDYQLRRHVRKRNRAMFEKNIFHLSDFFLDKIDFNLDKIDFNLDKIDFNLNKIFLLYLIFVFKFFRLFVR